MEDWLKRHVKRILRRFGLEVSRAQGSAHAFDHTFQRLAVLRDLGFCPATICDIGASDGRWSRKCLEVFPQARYFCVDPLDENRLYLAQLSAECPNVSYWHGCLGPKTGKAVLNVDGDGSSILPGHWGNPYGIQREIMIEALDNLIMRGVCLQPDLIKLDVQGYELEVLKGATSTVSKTQAIIVETSFFSFQSGMPVFHEVVEQFAENGFVVYDMLSLHLRPLDDAVGQTDLLFLQAVHPLRYSNKWDRNSIY
jgi:FkbM family methyltransferase